mgnify:CR=1 FL=1
MKKFNVKETNGIIYQQTTYQGTVTINGEDIKWRHSEDDNIDEFYVFEDGSWERSDLTDPKHLLIYAAICIYGNPEDWEEGEDIVIGDEDLEMYS